MSKYHLGNQSFNTWEDVTKHARLLLLKGIRTLTGNDLQFVLDLLEFHPRKHEKTQNGISAIVVDYTPYFTNSGLYGFAIIDSKGIKDFFSYKKCLSKYSGHRRKIVESISYTERISCYREAVSYQAQKVKSDLLKTDSICNCCGSSSNLQVDHKTKSFISIVNEFEEFYKPDRYPTVEKADSGYTVYQFKQTKKTFTDFINAWQVFHNSQADYQILCRSCNARKGSSGSKYHPYVKDGLKNT